MEPFPAHYTAFPERRMEDLCRKFTFSQQLSRSLQMLSQSEARPVEALAEELLAYAVEQKQAAQRYWRCWNNLSRRQKEVVVLISRGYSNHEIARALVIERDNGEGLAALKCAGDPMPDCFPAPAMLKPRPAES